MHEEVEIPVERVKEERRMVETVREVPLEQEVIKEIVEDVLVYKDYFIKKIIDKPIFVPQYITRYVDKFVDVKETIEVPKFVETIIEHTVDKDFDAITKVERLNVRGVAKAVPMNTLVRGEVLSQKQMNRFNQSSLMLAEALEENIKVRAEIDHLKERLRYQQNKPFVVTPEIINQLRNQVDHLSKEFEAKKIQNADVRRRVESDTELNIDIKYDSTDLSAIQAQIRSIREHNEFLKGVARKGKFEETVVEIGRSVVASSRGAPLHSGSSGSYDSVSGSYSSRSPSQEIRYQPQQASRVVQGGRVYGERVVRASPSPVERDIRRSSPAPVYSRQVLNGYESSVQPRGYRVSERPVETRLVDRPVESRVNYVPNGQNRVYSNSRPYSGSYSGTYSGSSYSSYSRTPSYRTVSPSPEPYRLSSNNLPVRQSSRVEGSRVVHPPTNAPAKSKYQSTVDQVKNAGFTLTNTSHATPQFRNESNFMNTESSDSYSLKPRDTVSTSNNTFGQRGLIGDYSAAYRK